MLLAVVAHVLFGWGASELGLFDLRGGSGAPTPASATGLATASPGAEDDSPIEIQQLVDELRAPDRRTAEEQRREEEKKREEEAIHPEGQVVDIAQPPLEQRPDESARFLAEYDAKVGRETKGRPGSGSAGATEAVTGTAARREAARRGIPLVRPGLPGAPAPPSRSLPAATGERGQGGNPDPSSEEGIAPRPGAPATPGRLSMRGGEGGLPGAPGQPSPNLAPSEEMLARAIGKGAGSPDWLRDIDDGEATALNAKKWKYASFFNRLKRQVREEWHPDFVYMRHDPGGNVYGVKDRVTTVRVHLDADGKLRDIHLLQSSGVDFLDAEAMDAFRRAQPFLNPPPALVEADGAVHFTFAFIFELSGSTNVKVFKY